MTCAPSLLKFLGIKLSLEIVKPKAFAEQRLFQAILVQALEDAVNPSGFKKETYYKHDSHKWFVSNSIEFQDICWGAKLQVSWIKYRDLYKRYRECGTKEERRIIKKLILKENLKRLED